MGTEEHMQLNQKIDKLSENMSYMRGQFDTALPGIEKSLDKIGVVLEKHDKDIINLQTDNTATKTRITIFSSMGGVLGGAALSFIVGWLKKDIF